MADEARAETFQPFLLDRLSDDQQESSLTSRERRTMSPRDCRRAILRDLAWLLNSAAHAGPEMLERKAAGSAGRAEPSAGEAEADGWKRYPSAAVSVLNYGMPSLAGKTASSVTSKAIERRVRDAIVAFEPRLIERSVRVTAVESPDESAPYVVQLKISADAWNLTDPIEIRTEVDLDTGYVKLTDPSNPG